MEKAFIDISCIIIMVYIALQRLPLMRPHSLPVSKGFQVVYLFNIVWKHNDLARSGNSMKQKVSHGQGSKVSSEWMLFSKINFYLSFVML